MGELLTEISNNFGVWEERGKVGGGNYSPKAQYLPKPNLLPPNRCRRRHRLSPRRRSWESVRFSWFAIFPFHMLRCDPKRNFRISMPFLDLPTVFTTERLWLDAKEHLTCYLRVQSFLPTFNDVFSSIWPPVAAVAAAASVGAVCCRYRSS